MGRALTPLGMEWDGEGQYQQEKTSGRKRDVKLNFEMWEVI